MKPEFIANKPQDWTESNLFNLLESLTSGSRPLGGGSETPTGIFSLGGEHITDDGSFDFSNLLYVPTEFYEAIKEDAGISPEDILINKDGAKTGKLAIVGNDFPHFPTCINEHVFRLRANRNLIEPYLLFYFLLSFYGQRQLARQVQGSAQGGISRRFAKHIQVIFPSDTTEQRTIVHAVRAVDEAILKTTEEAAAARRLKTALMQQLFTRGIPGRHTRFQQTKVGEIPGGWQLKTLAAHCGGPDCVRTGPFGAQLPPEAFARTGVRMANITDIGEGELDLTSDFYVRPEVFDRLRDYALVEGDVVFSRVASVGRLGLIHKEHEPLLMSSNCIRLRPRGAFNSKFLTHVFLDAESVARQVEAMSNAGARPIVTPRFLRRMLIPRPPRDEQDEIASLIEAADANVRGVRSEITALERLKLSLLQNLLTGRVRVRVES